LLKRYLLGALFVKNRTHHYNNPTEISFERKTKNKKQKNLKFKKNLKKSDLKKSDFKNEDFEKRNEWC
jgi:hypothetical protein